MNRIFYCLFSGIFLFVLIRPALCQQQASDNTWHNKERAIRYKPDGEDFIIENGERRFNRALYGTNTGFRVEAGDLPEFALYLPGMGGNLQFGLISGNTSKWLIKTQHIRARYRPGSMIYEIKDPMLGKGLMIVTVLAADDHEGILIKTEFKDIEGAVDLFWGFGGATGKRFSRDGDIGADPESSFYLKPEYCKDNIYTLTRTTSPCTSDQGKNFPKPTSMR